MHSLSILWAAQLENTRERRKERRLFRQLEAIEDIPENLFVQQFRLNKTLFRSLCADLHTAKLKGTSEISLEMKVLCALSFFATGSYQKIVGLGLNLAQQTTSRCIREVVDAINDPWMVGRWITFPQTHLARSQIKEMFQRKYNLPGVIGCIDCTHIAIHQPNEEEHIFFNRKGYHSINVQMVCDSDLRILNVNSKFGGATHDSHIWSASHVESYMRELHTRGERVWLLGDSGYPQRPWLMTPILNADAGSRQQIYTTRHVQARSCIERCFGLLKARWRCLLRDRVLHYHPEMASKIVNACCVLHNIALCNTQYALTTHDIRENPQDDELGGDELDIEQITPNDELIRGRAMLNSLIERMN